MPTKQKVFLDSNIFIYLIDKDNAYKREVCKNLLLGFDDTQTPVVISTQVIKEVSSVLLRKFNYSIPDLKIFLRHLENFEVVETPPSVIQHGLDLMLSYSLSFWDSVIIASALYANCHTIYSEDFNDGQQIAGIDIKNPFS